MSKVARKPVLIPENIKFSVNENLINVEGPMGKLSFVKNDNISVVIEDGNAQVKTKDSEFIPLSGTTRALIFNSWWIELCLFCLIVIFVYNIFKYKLVLNEIIKPDFIMREIAIN